MPTPAQLEARRAFVDALRSTTQCCAVMRDGSRFCAVGLACDLAIRAGRPFRWEDRSYPNVAPKVSPDVPHPPGSFNPARELLLLHYGYSEDDFGTLMHWNDFGRTFTDIADVLSRSPDLTPEDKFTHV